MPDTTSRLPATSNPAQHIRCRHIKVDGTQCGCPALRGGLLCYFHHNWQLSTTTSVDNFASYVEDYWNKNPVDFVHNRLRPPTQREKAEHEGFLQTSFLRDACADAPLLLPILEDANSIQVALMKVMRLLLANAIPYKTASLLLYALQTASSNLARINFAPPSEQVVTAPFTVPVHRLNEREKNDCETKDGPVEDDQVNGR
jgi:hypothetical protein